jgi:hypothetical protein
MEIIRGIRVRSWLWRCHATAFEKFRALLRVRWVQWCALPSIRRALITCEAISPESVVAAYLLGSFPWVKSPNDLDIALIVEGDAPFGRKELHDIPFLRLMFHSIEKVDVECVGASRLERAVSGECVSMGVVIRRRALTYWGGIFLAGQDVFAQSRPPIGNFNVFVADLITDSIILSRWRFAGSAIERAEKKRRWRLAEAAALRRWIAEKHASRFSTLRRVSACEHAQHPIDNGRQPAW